MKKMNMDIVRFALAFLIVAIHTSPFGTINANLDFFVTRILARIAVPIYLCITGFFVLPKALNNFGELKKYLFKILKLYLVCILIYIPINIYMGDFKELTIGIFLKKVLLNGTIYHLWYFPALILGTFLVYLIIKYIKKPIIQIAIVTLLYVIGLLGDSYYGFIVYNNFLDKIYNEIFKIFEYTRCGIFYVPIFVYMGYFINTIKEKEKILGKKYNKTYILNICLIFFMMTIEAFFLKSIEVQKHDSMYIFLVPLIYFIFSFLVVNNNGQNIKLRNMATSIYIIHPMAIVAIRFICGILLLDELIVNNKLVMYIAVIISSFCFAYILENIKNKLKKGENEKNKKIS